VERIVGSWIVESCRIQFGLDVSDSYSDASEGVPAALEIVGDGEFHARNIAGRIKNGERKNVIARRKARGRWKVPLTP